MIWAKKNEVVGGYSDVEFGSDDNITRADFATILFRYAINTFIMFWNYYPGTEDRFHFSDSFKVPSYAELPVKLLSNVKVINGKNNGIFDPEAAITRAEAAAMLHRYDLNIVNQQSIIFDELDFKIIDVDITYDYSEMMAGEQTFRINSIWFVLDKVLCYAEMSDIEINGKIAYNGSTFSIPFYSNGKYIKADFEYLQFLPEIPREDKTIVIIGLEIFDQYTFASASFSFCSYVDFLN